MDGTQCEPLGPPEGALLGWLCSQVRLKYLGKSARGVLERFHAAGKSSSQERGLCPVPHILDLPPIQYSTQVWKLILQDGESQTQSSYLLLEIPTAATVCPLGGNLYLFFLLTFRGLFKIGIEHSLIFLLCTDVQMNFCLSSLDTAPTLHIPNFSSMARFCSCLSTLFLISLRVLITTRLFSLEC